MDYHCVLIAIILTSTTPRSSAITTHHNFRRHADPPPPADWEWALREATYQTLLRERYSEPSLHDYIFDAPMTGRTHGASPFGDVAVLARGQLYLTQSGFHFVQDPNAYDCDYCSSTIETGHRPIAIWVVRRIRHRDVNGHRYEIEYTVSPVRGGDFATENGNYNYALPGHVFVVVTDANPNDRRKYQNQNQYKVNEKAWNPHRGYLPVKADVGENRDRHYLPPHTTPPSYDYHQPGNKINDKESLERELELYKKLVQSLAMKAMGTTTPRLTTTMTVSSTYPTASDFDIFEEVKPLTAPVTVKTTQAPTPALDVTTIVHLAKPMVTSKPRQTTTFKTTVVFPTTPFIPSPTYVIYSEPDPLYSSTSTTTNQQTKPPPMFTTMMSRLTTTTSTSTTTTSRSTTKKSIPTYRRKVSVALPMVQATTTRRMKTTTTSSISDDIFDSFEPAEIQPQLPSPDIMDTTRVTGSTSATIKPTQPIKTTKKTTVAKTTKTKQEVVTKATTFKKPITKEPKKPVISTEETTQPTKQIIVTIKPLPTKTMQSITEETMLMLTKVTTTKQPIVNKVTMRQPIVIERPTTMLNKVTMRQPIVTERTTSMLSEVTTTERPIVTQRTTSMLSKVTMRPPIVTERTTTMLSKVPMKQPIVTERTTPMLSKVTTMRQPIITERTTSTMSETSTTPIEDTTTTVTKITTMTNKPPEDEETTNVQQTTETPTLEIKPETEGTESSMTSETEELTHQTIETTKSTTLETKTEQPKDQTTETPTSKQTPQTDTTSFISTQITEEISESPTTDDTTNINDTESPQTDETTTITKIPTTTKPNTTAKITQKTLDAVVEIFGELITETKPTTTPTSKPNTKEIDELFDDKPKKSKKRLVLNSIRLLSTATTAPKIIYSNFYAAAPDDEDFTTETENTVMEPRTIQSYSTSISFEVNKKNATSQSDEDATVRAKVVEVGANDSEYAVFRAELPDVTTVAAETTVDDRETTKVFDKIALSLVNHARSLDYVNAKDGDRKKKRKGYNSKYRSLGKN